VTAKAVDLDPDVGRGVRREVVDADRPEPALFRRREGRRLGHALLPGRVGEPRDGRKALEVRGGHLALVFLFAQAEDEPLRAHARRRSRNEKEIEAFSIRKDHWTFGSLPRIVSPRI
jgi:hypothetical protein